MMNFASQELNDWRESNNYFEFSSATSETKPKSRIDTGKLFTDKLCVPSTEAQVNRPRLIEHLQKSSAQFSATLITGRTGMGKTTLAAEFAKQSHYQLAWYKVDTADSDWNVFSSYLSGSVNQFNSGVELLEFDSEAMEVSSASEFLAAQFAVAAKEKPLLIVLDDLHSVFDADWFTEFFHSFVPSLAPNVHLLLIARTAPPLPLWRLRSKQVLGVMDEKLLTFTLNEAIELFSKYELSPAVARSAYKRTYGRVSKLKEIAEKKCFCKV
jgi:LuxR family maltose regulon positive regulatory protein